MIYNILRTKLKIEQHKSHYVMLETVSVATNTVVSHKRGQNRIMITTNGTYPWSFVT